MYFEFFVSYLDLTSEIKEYIFRFIQAAFMKFYLMSWTHSVLFISDSQIPPSSFKYLSVLLKEIIPDYLKPLSNKTKEGKIHILFLPFLIFYSI